MKAFLASRGIEFPKTHNINVLLALMPPGVSVTLSPE
jgi:hypothetical protein